MWGTFLVYIAITPLLNTYIHIHIYQLNMSLGAIPLKNYAMLASLETKFQIEKVNVRFGNVAFNDIQFRATAYHASISLIRRAIW